MAPVPCCIQLFGAPFQIPTACGDILPLHDDALVCSSLRICQLVAVNFDNSSPYVR
jgi:hypothetical protein